MARLRDRFLALYAARQALGGNEMPTFQFSIAVVLVTFTTVLLQNQHAAADDGTATVKGSVLLEGGQPLQGGGRIFFLLKDSQFVGARIKADGTFTVDNVPVGSHKVTLEGKGVPAKYSSEEKAVLEVEVKKGTNEIQIKLR
jgi:hypothetical protein